MNKKRSILLIALIAVVVGIFITYGLLNSTGGDPKAKLTETTKTFNYTDTEKKEISEQTSKGVLALVSANLIDQFAENELSDVAMNTQVLTEDPDKTKSQITVIAITGVPKNFDYIANGKHVVDTLTAYNDPNKEEGSVWQSKATEEFNTHNGETTVHAVKLWDEREDPFNPAIIEISYGTYTDGATTSYDIYISSSVY